MTHKVNAAVFRIGKSLNWHSLGSPLYRWSDLKINLFLNYFLARFLERESYRLVRYGVRSEKNFFKIAIVAFRIINTEIGRPRHVLKSFFESYWKDHYVYKYHFKLGVFSYALQGLEDPITFPYDDVVGTIYLDESRKFFSIGPYWDWTKTSIFFNDGIGMEESDPGDASPFGTLGFSAQFYIRIAARLMVLRYAVRKSFLRVVQRRVLAPRARIFARSKLFFPGEFKIENSFMKRALSSAMLKNLMFSFLIFKKKKKFFLKDHFKVCGGKFRNLIAARATAFKTKLMTRRLNKKKLLKFKKKHRVFKKSWVKWVKWFKKTRRALVKKAYRRGRYNLSRFFKRLGKKNKGFKHQRIYRILRSKKNNAERRFFNYAPAPALKEKVLENLQENEISSNSFFKGFVNLISFFNFFFSRGRASSFILILKKIFRSRRIKSSRLMRPLHSISKPFYRVFSVRRRVRKRGFIFFNELPPKRYKELFSLAVKRIISLKLLKRLKKKGFFKFKRFRRKVKNKINFFFYFFFANMAVFKSYRLRFKSDGAKYLYRKKKLIFFLEKRLSTLLKREIVFKFFNPFDINSIDDVWTTSLLDSLNFVSNLYLRDRLDYKPAFLLSIHTMLAFKYSSPAFLGSFIANQLEWRWRKRSHTAFIRLLIYFFKGLKFNTIYSKNLANFSVGFYGKVWGKLRAGKFIIRSAEGNALPLRRVSLKIDSSFTWAQSQFGTFGIRIWIARN